MTNMKKFVDDLLKVVSDFASNLLNTVLEIIIWPILVLAIIGLLLFLYRRW